MKIAVATGLFPKISEAFIVNLITGLLDAGHGVDVLAYYPAPGEAVPEDVYRYRLLDRTYYLPARRTADRMMRKIQNTFSRGMNLLVPTRWKYLPLSWKMRYILSHVAGKQYDVVHCQFGPIGLQYLFLKKFLPTLPLVVHFRGYDAFRYPRTAPPDVYQELFCKADAIVTNVRAMRKQLQKLGCPVEKIHLIPSPRDLKVFPYQKKVLHGEERVRLLTVARLVEKKGLLYSIRAAAKVMADRPRVEYNIVGEGPLRGALQKEIERLGMHGRINLVGAKTQGEVSDFYRQSHVFILASVTASDGDSEGQGGALQEAQACGLPVVATRHSGLPEGLREGESGFLVPERDVEALAERLSYLVNHPERWPSMGSAGRKFVEGRYDKHVVAQQLSNFYSQLSVSKENGERLAAESPPIERDTSL